MDYWKRKITFRSMIEALGLDDCSPVRVTIRTSDGYIDCKPDYSNVEKLMDNYCYMPPETNGDEWMFFVQD
jgi:hypothetical protein